MKVYILLDRARIAEENRMREFAKQQHYARIRADVRKNGGLASLSPEVMSLLGPLADEIRAEEKEAAQT